MGFYCILFKKLQQLSASCRSFFISGKSCVLNMNHALGKPYHDSFPTDQVDAGAERNVNLCPSI